MITNNYKVKPNIKVKLSGFWTDSGLKKTSDSSFKQQFKNNIDEISKCQYKLYAEDHKLWLITLQGMDSSEKEGTIMHVSL